LRTTPLDEFNSVAVPSEGLLRKLAYLAATGNEAVLLPFTLTGGAKAEAERQRKEREFENFARMVLASRERVEEFTKKLELLDQASAEALVESEEKLRKAKDDLQRLRERAYELTTPDGGAMKVYRDGRMVRDDDGAQVDPLLIKPEDIPESAPTWGDIQDKEATLRDAERQRREISEYRERLEKTRKRLDEGAVSEAELDKLNKDAERMPALVREHYEQLAPDTKERAQVQDRTPESRSSGGLLSEARPTQPFAVAAAGLKPAVPGDDADLDFKKVIPGVSAPSPM
jgi:hypothetical protein